MITPFHIIEQFAHQHRVVVFLASEAAFVLAVIGWMVISSFQHLLCSISFELHLIRQHLEARPTEKKQEDVSNG